MTPLQYLTDKLNLISKQFPHVHIKYAYNEAIHSHIVELTPESEYYNNEELDKAWVPISLEFKSLFEEEDIVFISSDSLLEVKEPHIEWNAQRALFDYALYSTLIDQLYKISFSNVEFPVADEFLSMPSINSEYIINAVYETHVKKLKEKHSTTIITFNSDILQPCGTEPFNIVNNDDFSLAA